MSSFDYPEMSSVSAPMSVEWKEILGKAALTGAIAGVAASFLTSGSSVSIAGMSMPGAVGAGLGCAAGSITGDLAHKYILPQNSQNQKFINMESTAISVGASIAGAYLGMAAIGGPVPITTAAILGGGSFVASDYTYHRVLNMGNQSSYTIF